MFPFTGFRLLLPAIVPSWRFFDVVTASPRLDYALLSSLDEVAELWHEFRPRPANMTLGNMLGRLLWNAEWNENLYLVSLAERLTSTNSTAQTKIHSEHELLLRVARHLDRQTVGDPRAYLQIQLRFLSRTDSDEQLASRTVYRSSPYLMTELTTR